MSITSSSMRLFISESMVAWVPSRASGPLSSTLAGQFWNFGVNDEVWVVTMVDAGSGFRTYDYLMIPMTDGGDETWVICGVILCQVELDSTSLWVVLICCALSNRFGNSLINC